MKRVTILINCEDKQGIIASVTTFIQQEGGNIVYIDQHVDREDAMFFMRLEGEFSKAVFSVENFKDRFCKNIAENFNMNWHLFDSDIKPRMALFVSKYEHCLYDILSRYSSNELDVEIPLIISNHPNLEPIAKNFNIPYFYIKVTKDTKAEAEELQLKLLREHNVDFIVLARYMQILSSKLIADYNNQIINIHHSFYLLFRVRSLTIQLLREGLKLLAQPVILLQKIWMKVQLLNKILLELHIQIR